MIAADLHESSDAAVVVAIGRWRRDALAEAYRRHAGPVFGLAKRVLQSEHMAEEVVQEVFLQLWNAPERFDAERGSLRSYLLALAHGKSVDMLRSETSRRTREERVARLQPDQAYDLEREVADLATADRVKEVVGMLPEDERRAIELAYFGGLTYRDVSVTLEVPEGTAKSRIRTGLRRMREALERVGVERWQVN